MSNSLYTRDILRLATSIPHERRLIDPQASAELRAKTCGSRVAMDVILDEKQQIQQLGVEVQACALGQASTAIVSGAAIGRSREQISAARQALADFLSGDSDDLIAIDAQAKAKLDLLRPARPHKGRHDAILLPYDSLIAAIDKAQAETA